MTPLQTEIAQLEAKIERVGAKLRKATPPNPPCCGTCWRSYMFPREMLEQDRREAWLTILRAKAGDASAREALAGAIRTFSAVSATTWRTP